jgi:hypothetical protein
MLCFGLHSVRANIACQSFACDDSTGFRCYFVIEMKCRVCRTDLGEVIEKKASEDCEPEYYVHYSERMHPRPLFPSLRGLLSLMFRLTPSYYF